jgi:hypothetical protein
MKWGVRRYQNADGSLTAAGKKRYYKMAEDERDKWVEKLSAKNKALAKKEAARKDIDETKDAERKAKEDAEFEANKKSLLMSGSASEIMKYKGRFTNDELNYAKLRLGYEKDLANIAAEEAKKGERATKEAMDKLARGVDYAQTAAKAWNTFANFYNAFSGGHVLSKIDTDIAKGNKDAVDKYKAEKKAADEKAAAEAKAAAERREAEAKAAAEKKAAEKAARDKEKAAKRAQKQAEENDRLEAEEYERQIKRDEKEAARAKAAADKDAKRAQKQAEENDRLEDYDYRYQLNRDDRNAKRAQKAIDKALEKAGEAKVSDIDLDKFNAQLLDANGAVLREFFDY